MEYENDEQWRRRIRAVKGDTMEESRMGIGGLEDENKRSGG